MPLMRGVKGRVIKEFFRTRSYRRRNVVDDLLSEDPFDFSPEWKRKFLEAMRWSFRHHSRNSRFYRGLCREKGLDGFDIRDFDDIWDIPFVIPDVFKHHRIYTSTWTFLKTEIISSGTSGRKSRVILDLLSARRLMRSIYDIYRALGAVDDEPVNYLMMAYNPAVDDRPGTTVSDVVISNLAPRKDMFYALDLDGNGGMSFLGEKAVKKLRDYIEEGSPIRILGFIHHTCELIRAYNKKYGRVLFPEKSFILTGGGWKNSANPYGEDFDYLRFLSEMTNIDLRKVRDLYTLNEHAIFYLECEEHNMHIPNVAIACARDPRTLRRLPNGQTGLIHLYSPMIESCPLLSVLTSDCGYIRDNCSCSVGGPYIKIFGRAEVVRTATCAVTADSFMQKGV